MEFYNKDKGKALFNPTIVKPAWDDPSSRDKNEFWFPYWMTLTEISAKERYGQYSPMIGEKALLELFRRAIGKDFFSKSFLRGLDRAITKKLGV